MSARISDNGNPGGGSGSSGGASGGGRERERTTQSARVPPPDASLQATTGAPSASPSLPPPSLGTLSAAPTAAATFPAMTPVGPLFGVGGATSTPPANPAGTLPAPPGGPPSATPMTPATDPDLRAPALYLNRELAWLEFNARVLAEADSDQVPLLERVKFHSIFCSNLDEFFMVRVAALKQQLTGEVEDLPADGLGVGEALNRISERAHTLVDEQWRSLEQRLLPALRDNGYWLVKPQELPEDVLAGLEDRFKNEIFPILTPIAIDPGHPFPHVRNKSLNLGVMFQREGTSENGFGVVQVPTVLSRIMEVGPVRLGPDGTVRQAFVLLEDLIARHVGTIFPGVRLRGVYTFRVTRNFDLEIDEEEAEDLLHAIQQELRRRERGNAVRLEVSGQASRASLAKLVNSLKLDADRDVYVTHKGFLNVADLIAITPKDGRRDLRDEPFAPLPPPELRDADDLFAVIRDGDILMHHPYDSFDALVELIVRAAEDPDVLAIKQTLYRAGGDSPIVKALARAAEAGKQVTAIVELKARFDEASNIVWARTLEQSGVHVVYGLLGLKTHAKCLLIVRREKAGLRRYVHLSTGNYNTTTSRYYTDIALLTCRASICEDASSLFNLLTGYSAPPRWNALIVAPLGLHEAILGLIARETEHARQGRPARIVAKMNSLVDEDVIEALYRASQAGVPITLLIRGVSCLRPGVPGVSENIQVLAIIDRYLEHGRIFHFSNGGKDDVYISSADWMPRNFHRRVEVMVPIEDAGHRHHLIEFLKVTAHDNVKSWMLRNDGSYERVTQRSGQTPLRSQQRFIDLTRGKTKVAEHAARSGNRFLMAASAQKSPLEGKVPKTTRRRPRKSDEP